VAELKAAVELLHTLVTSPKPSTSSLSSTLAAMSETQQRVSPPTGLSSSALVSPVASLNPPSEDASRKRCASAQGDEDDRVLKSLKLEVNEDATSTSSLSSAGPSSGLPFLPLFQVSPILPK